MNNDIISERINSRVSGCLKQLLTEGPTLIDRVFFCFVYGISTLMFSGPKYGNFLEPCS